MRTIKLEIFQFGELSDESKQKALNNFKSLNNDLYLDIVNFDVEEMIRLEDFEDVTIKYSLSYSQGDGFSFSGTDGGIVEKVALAILGEGKKRTAKVLANRGHLMISGNAGRSFFSSQEQLEFNFFDARDKYSNIYFYIKKIEKVLKAKYMELCSIAEEMIYKEIEWQHSDKYAIDKINAFEMEFFKDGTLLNKPQYTTFGINT